MLNKARVNRVSNIDNVVASYNAKVPIKEIKCRVTSQVNCIERISPHGKICVSTCSCRVFSLNDRLSTIGIHCKPHPIATCDCSVFIFCVQKLLLQKTFRWHLRRDLFYDERRRVPAPSQKLHGFKFFIPFCLRFCADFRTVFNIYQDFFFRICSERFFISLIIVAYNSLDYKFSRIKIFQRKFKFFNNILIFSKIEQHFVNMIF